MKNSLYPLGLLTILSLLSYDLNAQVKAERDSVEIGLRGHVYQNDRRLTMRGIENLMRYDEEATEAFKKAKLNFQLSQGAYVIGAALIITPLAISLTDNDPVWGMAALGVVSIGAGVLLNQAKNRWLLESVRLYHENLAQTGAYLQGGNTIGISYSITLK